MNKLFEVQQKIKERGYWEIVLRPVQYTEKKFTYQQLRNWLEKHQLQNRGWYYPHLSENKDFGIENPTLKNCPIALKLLLWLQGVRKKK